MTVEVLKNFYSDRQTIVDAVVRDATHLWKNDIFTDSDIVIPGGYNSYSTIEVGIPRVNQYHLTSEIAPLAAAVEGATGLTIVQCWGNVEQSDQWIGRHAHKNPIVTTIAMYHAQVIRGELLYFEYVDGVESLSLAENQLLVFDSLTPHGFKPRTRSKDKVTVTFELRENELHSTN